MMRPTRNVMSLFLCFAEETRGSVAVEYTLIASAVCIVLVGIVVAMGQKLVIMFTSALNMFN
jgi:Flp pilus assembly pilin Flp